MSAIAKSVGTTIDAPEGCARTRVVGIRGRHDAAMDCAKDQWDDLLRVSASIGNGTVSAVLVVQRFGSAAQGDRLYRAAKTVGRLLRTIYLCDYFTQPEFRREIHRVLNRGESVHTLQRAIHFGEVPQERGRRAEEMIAISVSFPCSPIW